MAKPKFRSYSHYARDIVQLLGLMIRSTRIERNITTTEVAERAGISRGLVQRIESGNMGTSIGVTFEVAAIVGLELFETEPSNLKRHLSLERDKLVLLKSVRKKKREINDNF